MNVEVDLRGAADVVSRLKNGQRKLPGIAVRSINLAGERAQAAVREMVRGAVTVRTPFVLSQVKLLKASFSTAEGATNRWQATLGIGIGKAPRGSPLLLPMLETGGARKGVKGGAVAVPVAARPSKPQSIPEALWIQRLQLRRPTRGRPKKGAAPVRAGTLTRVGAFGTYMISKVGIFQRGAGPVARLLYAFKPVVRVPRVLRFYQVASKTIREVFPRAMAQAIGEAFRK